MGISTSGISLNTVSRQIWSLINFFVQFFFVLRGRSKITFTLLGGELIRFLISLIFYLGKVNRNKAKSLQSNSGPMCAFVFVCWHRGEAMQTGYQQKSNSSYSGELLTAGRCKKYHYIGDSTFTRYQGSTKTVSTKPVVACSVVEFAQRLCVPCESCGLLLVPDGCCWSC